jgi:hypothetical protein
MKTARKKNRVFRCDDLLYDSFVKMCEEKGILPSKALRRLMEHFTVKNLLSSRQIKSLKEVLEHE